MSSRQSLSSVRIGLALSGGGFRASFYHLGTIRCLEELGIMKHVEVMSTVSGGSIIGAYYLVEMEKKLRASVDPENFDRLQACDEIINSFCAEVRRNFRMRAILFFPFYHPIITLLSILRLRHRGDTMAKEFERRLFAPQLRMGDLPVQTIYQDPCSKDYHRTGTRLLLNTTSLITGRRVVYSRESDTGLTSQIAKSDPNNIVLARVVGASAAVPGVFKPLKVEGQVLADGGVVDNQGIESLFDYFKVTEERFNELTPDFRQPEVACGSKHPLFFLVSDGAGQFSIKADTKATRAGAAARSMSVLQAGNRRKTLKYLKSQLVEKGKPDSRKLTGFAFTHLAMNIKGRPNLDKGRLMSEFIVPTAELRTDLDEFSRLERDVLIYHGYTLMHTQIAEYCKDLIRSEYDTPRRPARSRSRQRHFTWPPSFVAICAPRSRKAAQARRWISKFLSVGRHPLFRDVRRFPWVFGPVLFLFVLAALSIGLYLSGQLFDPGEGVLAAPIADWLQKTAIKYLPSWNIPYVADFRLLRTRMDSYRPTIMLVSKVLSFALSTYVVMWFYYEFKSRSRLAEHLERLRLWWLSLGPDEDQHD